jgi:hypothetical protein
LSSRRIHTNHNNPSTLSSLFGLVGVQDLSWNSRPSVWTPTRQKQLDSVLALDFNSPITQNSSLKAGHPSS